MTATVATSCWSDVVFARGCETGPVCCFDVAQQALFAQLCGAHGFSLAAFAIMQGEAGIRTVAMNSATIVAAEAHSNGASKVTLSNFCRSKWTKRNAASGLPPSDLRNKATFDCFFAGRSKRDMAITSFWQIEPPVDTQ